MAEPQFPNLSEMIQGEPHVTHGVELVDLRYCGQQQALGPATKCLPLSGSWGRIEKAKLKDKEKYRECLGSWKREQGLLEKEHSFEGAPSLLFTRFQSALTACECSSRNRERLSGLAAPISVALEHSRKGQECSTLSPILLLSSGFRGKKAILRGQVFCPSSSLPTPNVLPRLF